MQFRNFPAELEGALKRGANIANFQIAWKKAIIKEINLGLYLDALAPEDDLTTLALYRLLQRYYYERGADGFNDITKLWVYLINQEKNKEEQIMKLH